jgi:trehalose 6-phosphate phosphatase
MTCSESPPPWTSPAALFLDVDGTLLEIVDHPEQVLPTERLIKLMPRLPEATGGAVALISGRSIESLDQIFQPLRLPAAGLHGLVRRDSHGESHRVSIAEDWLADVVSRLHKFVAAHSGLLVEDKGLSVALHYRQRPDMAGDVARFVELLSADLPEDAGVLAGRMVYEFKPTAQDKGSAIRAFMTEAPFAGRHPIFIGDDVTDEVGFAAINELAGTSVKVGDLPTIADWKLDSVDHVIQWLETAIGQTKGIQHD